MKNSYLLTLLLALGLNQALFAQSNKKENFLEALYLMDDKRFSEAKPLLENLLGAEPENANLNFNMGLAMANSPSKADQEAALTYFEKAINEVDPNYTPYSIREEKAPVDAYYYYGRSLHTAMQFDKAIVNYEKFQEFINEKHYLYEEVQNRIGMSTYAKEAVKNPRNVTFTNLGGELNSKYPDYSPAIRIDESAIYFTSRRLRKDSSNLKLVDQLDGRYREDIYIAFNENGSWSEPQTLNISSDGNEATLNLSVDGKTLYLYKGEDNNGALYESKLLADSAGIEQWSKPELLGSNINDPKANESHVSIGPAGDILFFTSDREGGFGGMDIYFCRKLPNGEWAEAVNIGPKLNTNFNEDAVFMHPDGKTLYFSSNGHPSIGGYDIFSSTRNEEGWEAPSNLGYPINSVQNDIFFVTTPDGKRAYFSSYKDEGYGETDIYQLELIDAAETPLTLYKGKFTFANNNRPPDGALVTVIGNYDGEVVGYYNPRQRDGEFSVILSPNQSYHFIYEADGFKTYEEDIFVPAGSSYQEIFKDIKLKPVQVREGGSSITSAALKKASVAGMLSTNDTAVAGQTLFLESDMGEQLNTYTTDENGDFKLDEMQPSKSYVLRLDDEPKASFRTYDLNLKNDRDEDIEFTKRDDKSVIFVPSRYPFEFYGIQAKSLAGTIRGSEGPLSGLKIRLEDSGFQLIKILTTDEYGRFNFEKLSADERYRLLIDGDLSDEPMITITNELGEELTFRRVSEGVYEYIPKASAKGTEITAYPRFNGELMSGIEVQLLDENGEMILTETTNDEGGFTFRKLDLDNRYQISFVGVSPDDSLLVFTNEYGEKLTFMKVKEGVYQYVPRPLGFKLKSYTLSVSDEKAFKETYPQPKELKDVIVYFQKYFPYNATDIDLNNADFKAFINDVANVVKRRGFVQIIITSSASKVPTRSFKGNSELTKKRAYATKKMLEEVIRAKGVNESQYNFVDINTLITGPEYKNDATQNRSLYEKYQYVRIFIK